ncbi:MAG: bifunctional UDP-3-O-[3-hydroxymyristoyl] N-acetylglucosamine deacetylase/3-hydroxyacyl-ACP dehydratase [Bacteroidetes bacterium]|nr:bifunctional UDP-3-O-[3-hydroxymyristoyl] N-acetylglucosamine deacetylase/3-hydroxyacyl-ACP dehydratase [Bacteroidota bacterium]MDA0937769.1 bifunctional UDP-3-O-[3-hydroxymyristoyl] N-acetylglucosamine deacetylase/3-hydroxyacyl-ACP dehydratase [Bacteroidota bacterium]MDA1344265.1 bifunctional UDP-3-O-[3-hydroxymyristoyl] N-acetylglucosamine deacetylase/3-hydroxyacyl-ACP dehydratase [Bacteroidota bacterium]
MIRRGLQQNTISEPISLEGVGLHTGINVQLTFKPAPPDTGYVFVRDDIEAPNQIKADAQYVVNTDRGTNLEFGDLKIFTSEHVLAALVGLDITNCYIHLNAPEPPIMDGSSKYFVEALKKAGIAPQDEPGEYFEVTEVISYKDPDSGSEITVIPSDNYQVTTMVDFGTKVLGTQNATLENMTDFETKIAPARTFSFLHEIEMLLDHGLIKGGDLNNAIVYVDKPLSDATMEKLKIAFKKDNLSVKPNGILDNLTLHYSNEAARHKLLDVIGDLALIGMPIRGHVIAKKPGHKTNTAFSKKMAQVIKAARRQNAPIVDLNAEPLMDVNDIINVLPHRPPFLLVDKIYELSDHHVVGVKNVTMNEPFFQGHFPGAPVMPGVLQIEAMAQAGGVLVLNTVPDPQNYLTFFIKIDNVKFKRPVHPGDTLIFKLDLITPIRRGICHMKGCAFANGQLVTEGELMAQIIKRKDA